MEVGFEYRVLSTWYKKQITENKATNCELVWFHGIDSYMMELKMQKELI